MAQLRDWIWLTTRRHLSLKGQLQALSYFGSPEEIYLADKQAVQAVPGLTGREREALMEKDFSKADNVLEDCAKFGIQILTYQDAAYPQRLRNIDTPPLVLYYRGTLLPFDELPVITVVGARKASGYGLTVAKRMGYQLGASGGVVVSGAARGIDSLALEGALSAGGTVAAVLGNGLDIVYPAEAKGLYQDVEAHGCLISEYIPGTKPLGQNFPRRNRIMSGLALGVLVVEAARKSGSLITAELALEQGRDVFAVPGNIGLEASAGSNALLQEGAILATSGWDILREYAPRFPERIHRAKGGGRTVLSPGESARDGDAQKVAQTVKTPEISEESEPDEKKSAPEPEKGIDIGQKRNYIDLQEITAALTEDERAIAQALSQGQRHVDDIIAETGLPPARVLASLTLLEVKGYVLQQPGKRFELNIT